MRRLTEPVTCQDQENACLPGQWAGTDTALARPHHLMDDPSSRSTLIYVRVRTIKSVGRAMLVSAVVSRTDGHWAVSRWSEDHAATGSGPAEGLVSEARADRVAVSVDS